MIDFLQVQAHLPPEVAALRLLVATLLGGALGFEREWRGRPAGLRTHMLVALASATFAILAIEIVHMPGFATDALRADPLRLISAITGGVAFIAAGFIIFHRGAVHGVTSGAGIWLASAMGLACGLGVWHIAALATVLGVAILIVFRRVEVWLDLKPRRRRSAKDEAPEPKDRVGRQASTDNTN